MMTTKKIPTPDQAKFIERWSVELEGSSPEEILRWAFDTYSPKLTMGTALGNSGCVILSMLAKLNLRIPIFNLDTGYQFSETLELIDRINAKYRLGIVKRSSDISVAEFEAVNGGALYEIDSDRCCYERKVKVLESIAPDYDAWISGLRRDQGSTRVNTPVVGWDSKFGLVKIAPLVNWTNKDVWKRIVDESVPYNSLYDQGYTSIGCEPCTRPTTANEDERAGRWAGKQKTECGLHG
ncbi:MAG: phosphoadenylyl-sulfate reductase [Planctomycetaceae bacterium]|jgi:phosphoadenosine phosphosulfate reductase|nr:phosphoadenylyl-sulfate reductase [Planctomycetaceae bacterium]